MISVTRSERESSRRLPGPTRLCVEPQLGRSTRFLASSGEDNPVQDQPVQNRWTSTGGSEIGGPVQYTRVYRSFLIGREKHSFLYLSVETLGETVERLLLRGNPAVDLFEEVLDDVDLRRAVLLLASLNDK